MFVFLCRNNCWKYIILLSYILLLSIAIVKHEPWFDEAQAWLLARDSTLYDLLLKYARYEGSPSLWHLLLMVPAKAGMPYYFISLLAGSIASVSAYIFVRYSPFPWFIKLLYPFSFFAFYQYAVIARSYVLIPLLLFLIAMVHNDRINKPYLYILLVCLLANVSIHGLLISLGIISVHVMGLIKTRIFLDSSSGKHHLATIGIFAIMVLLLFFQLYPPDDLISFASFKHDLKPFWGRSIFMLSDSIATSQAMSHGFENNFTYACRIIFGLAIVTSLIWFAVNRTLLMYILPTLGLCILFTLVYANVWHQGALFFTWLFALWISYAKQRYNNAPVSTVKRLAVITLGAVLLVQVYWSFNSFRYDYSNNYSAGKELAAFIKQNSLESKQIYITSFHSVSILPYFSDNLFCNYNNRQKPSFWKWSGENTMYTVPVFPIKNPRPDLIIYGIKGYYKNNSVPKIPTIHGYRVLKKFHGCLYWKDRPFETDSFILYEKVNNR